MGHLSSPEHPPPVHGASAEQGGAPSVRVGFETARLRLAEIKDEGRQAKQSAYRVACRHSAEALQVERVSVWLFGEGEESIECLLCYTRSTGQFSSGDRISRQTCPAYFEAIASRRVVVAHDARADARTSELRSYLERNGIGALLDAPIYRDGRVIGVVCHEHLGGSRTWTEKEAGFGAAVADMLTILIDQAERAELRAALEAQQRAEAQQHKMQALLRLSRVVVHDLSNVLTVASLQASVLPGEDDVGAASADIQQVLGYGNKLLEQLRDFCAERAPSSRVEVGSVVRGLEPVLGSLLGRDVRLRVDCALEPVELSISKVELEQLILNLVMNAKDAIDPGGEVGIVVRRDVDAVVLEVFDNGSGIDEQEQARLFEPFYSTKPGHTGIGLSAVYGIVERARGTLELDSARGRGTTFTIRLPLDVDAASALDPPWGL
jgi:signal transduction histidine kinase